MPTYDPYALCRAQLGGTVWRACVTRTRVSIGLENAGWLHKVLVDTLKVAKDVHQAKMNMGV